VNVEKVSYKINGIDIAANVYKPASYTPNGKFPAIVVAHPNGGVKEQVAGLYAQKLAEQGYVTIAFDAAYQGASGGKPRYVDKPANRMEDIRAAADFITQYPGVDKNRLGLLGICGGGGYSIKVAQTDKRFNLAGDTTFREIPDTAHSTDLMVSHGGYDNADANKDINCMFPIDRLHELAKEGFIGSVAEFHYGFMGGGGDQEAFTNSTGPEIAKKLKEENVDAVILTAG